MSEWTRPKIGQRVIMQGHLYEVLEYQSREEIAAKTPLVAAHMGSGVYGHAVLRKPKGRRVYLADDCGPEREERGWSRYLPRASF